uniref:Uncharacterized protein n=1 Tax=Rhizophora mucronata TaxID=61149 RepID=A0A2P2N070_RHIMU
MIMFHTLLEGTNLLEILSLDRADRGKNHVAVLHKFMTKA